MKKLIYINKDIEDIDTGANCNFHILTGYEVKIENQEATLIFSSYVSKKMYDLGRNALSDFFRINLDEVDFDPEKPLQTLLKDVVKNPPKNYEPDEDTRFIRDPYFFSGGKVHIEDLTENSDNTDKGEEENKDNEGN